MRNGHTRFPVLLWAAVIAFGFNVLVFSAVFFSPNFAGKVYGKLSEVRVLANRPSPFQELKPVTASTPRVAARLSPILLHQSAEIPGRESAQIPERPSFFKPAAFKLATFAGSSGISVN